MLLGNRRQIRPSVQRRGAPHEVPLPPVDLRRRRVLRLNFGHGLRVQLLRPAEQQLALGVQNAHEVVLFADEPAFKPVLAHQADDRAEAGAAAVPWIEQRDEAVAARARGGQRAARGRDLETAGLGEPFVKGLRRPVALEAIQPLEGGKVKPPLRRIEVGIRTDVKENLHFAQRRGVLLEVLERSDGGIVVAAQLIGPQVAVQRRIGGHGLEILQHEVHALLNLLLIGRAHGQHLPAQLIAHLRPEHGDDDENGNDHQHQIAQNHLTIGKKGLVFFRHRPPPHFTLHSSNLVHLVYIIPFQSASVHRVAEFKKEKRPVQKFHRTETAFRTRFFTRSFPRAAGSRSEFT